MNTAFLLFLGAYLSARVVYGVISIRRDLAKFDLELIAHFGKDKE